MLGDEAPVCIPAVLAAIAQGQQAVCLSLPWPEVAQLP